MRLPTLRSSISTSARNFASHRELWARWRLAQEVISCTLLRELLGRRLLSRGSSHLISFTRVTYTNLMVDVAALSNLTSKGLRIAFLPVCVCAGTPFEATQVLVATTTDIRVIGARPVDTLTVQRSRTGLTVLNCSVLIAIAHSHGVVAS